MFNRITKLVEPAKKRMGVVMPMMTCVWKGGGYKYRERERERNDDDDDDEALEE